MSPTGRETSGYTPERTVPLTPGLGGDTFRLDNVLRALAVPRVSIVGVSLGGWLALDYAIRRPETVDRLAVCVPAASAVRSGVLVAALLLMPFGR
jgi:pimeloyl-ACP methyl ester carboxylesterase